MKKIFIALVLVLIMGCISNPIKQIFPVETKTELGQTIERIEPQRTDSRDNVPVGVEPSHVITHIKTKTGGEVWIVKNKNKVEVYQNPQAKAEGITVDRPKKSYAWIYWIVGIVAGMLIIDFAIRRFLGFNPIAWVFKRIFRK